MSLIFTLLYISGLAITSSYLFLLEAWAGAASISVELILGILLLLSKIILDRMNSSIKRADPEEVNPEEIEFSQRTIVAIVDANIDKNFS